MHLQHLGWFGSCFRGKSPRKPSITGVITGAIAGLAGVTPAAGYISAQNSFFLGIILGFASYYGILLLKQRLKIDDALDVGSIHGITGIVGSLAIGLIASSIINPAGPNGLLYGNLDTNRHSSIGRHGGSHSLGFGGTIIIMKIINAVIGPES